MSKHLLLQQEQANFMRLYNPSGKAENYFNIYSQIPTLHLTVLEERLFYFSESLHKDLVYVYDVDHKAKVFKNADRA